MFGFLQQLSSNIWECVFQTQSFVIDFSFFFSLCYLPKFVTGLFSYISLYSERELVKVEQIWRLGYSDTTGTELRKKRPFGPHPSKYVSVFPSFANY